LNKSQETKFVSHFSRQKQMIRTFYKSLVSGNKFKRRAFKSWFLGCDAV